MKKLTIILTIALFSTSLSAQILSEWRGIDRTGVYQNEKNLLTEWPETGPELIWSIDSIPVSYSSIAVVEDAIFTTGLKDTMEVLMKLTKSGKLLWETTYGRGWMSSFSESRCTPTVESTRVYVSSGMGDVACINAADGKIIWQHQTCDDFKSEPARFGISESLLVDDKNVYFLFSNQFHTIFD